MSDEHPPINILDFAISLEKSYSVFSQQNPWELAVKKSIFSKNWIPLQAWCKDFNHKITYQLLVKSVFTVWKIDILSTIRGLLKLKFPSNGQLHSYFPMILVTFYETFQDLLETRGGSILQNTSMIASDTRFHFCNFFLCLQ